MAPALEVHLVPHTHLDPGWLDTFEGYYKKDVRQILMAVLAALYADANRTFVWSETSFLHRYYQEISVRARARLRGLVQSGRLEIVGGGWVQHDEALTTPLAAAAQMAEGHAWVREALCAAPRVGWQLDPFGHSSMSAALHAQMGFDALVINRIHHATKRAWRNGRHLEFMWDLDGLAPPLLTHVLHTHYSMPPGIDFESGRPYLAAAISSVRSVVEKRADAYRTRHVMLLLGDDFRWHKAEPAYATWQARRARARHPARSCHGGSAPGGPLGRIAHVSRTGGDRSGKSRRRGYAPTRDEPAPRKRAEPLPTANCTCTKTNCAAPVSRDSAASVCHVSACRRMHQRDLGVPQWRR